MRGFLEFLGIDDGVSLFLGILAAVGAAIAVALGALFVTVIAVGIRDILAGVVS